MVTKTINGVSLKITYNKGQNENGKDILKYQRFKNINTDISDDDLYLIGDSLSKLINYPRVSLKKEEEGILLDQQ